MEEGLVGCWKRIKPLELPEGPRGRINDPGRVLEREVGKSQLVEYIEREREIEAQEGRWTGCDSWPWFRWRAVKATLVIGRGRALSEGSRHG